MKIYIEGGVIHFAEYPMYIQYPSGKLVFRNPTSPLNRSVLWYDHAGELTELLGIRRLSELSFSARMDTGELTDCHKYFSLLKTWYEMKFLL